MQDKSSEHKNILKHFKPVISVKVIIKKFEIQSESARKSTFWKNYPKKVFTSTQKSLLVQKNAKMRN